MPIDITRHSCSMQTHTELPDCPICDGAPSTFTCMVRAYDSDFLGMSDSESSDSSDPSSDDSSQLDSSQIAKLQSDEEKCDVLTRRSPSTRTIVKMPLHAFKTMKKTARVIKSLRRKVYNSEKKANRRIDVEAY